LIQGVRRDLFVANKCPMTVTLERVARLGLEASNAAGKSALQLSKDG